MIKSLKKLIKSWNKLKNPVLDYHFLSKVNYLPNDFSIQSMVFFSDFYMSFYIHQVSILRWQNEKSDICSTQ